MSGTPLSNDLSSLDNPSDEIKNTEGTDNRSSDLNSSQFSTKLKSLPFKSNGKIRPSMEGESLLNGS